MPIAEAFSRQDIANEERVVKLFDIAYHLAKNELPFSYFPLLVALEKRHGVDLGNTYNNSKQAATFTSFLAADIRGKMVEEVKAAKYISILVDGSTDKSTKELEVLYVKYMDQTGNPNMRFWG